jgi:uncharacterized protein YndB with AHSA1/START domain
MESKRVRVVRQQPMSIERAFDAWLDPYRIRQWMLAPSPADSIVSIEINPQAGGEFRFVVRRDGEEVDHVGHYLVVERPRRLVFTWLVPRYSQVATTVALDFTATADWECAVTLTQDGVPAEFAERTAVGWGRIIDAVARSAT